MRLIGPVFVASAFLMFSGAGIGQDVPPRGVLASSIQVKLPAGNVKIEFVESREGMVLIVNRMVQAQRIYLGNGKVAVLFEASHMGLFTPSGLVNAAAVDYKEGSVLRYNRDKQEAWGARPREVYVLTPSIKFEVQE